jgi:hypothetical protein
MITRRALLCSTAVVPVAAVEGCQFLTSLPQYAQDVQNIATDLGTVQADIAAIKGVPADVMAGVQSALDKIKTIGAQIGSAASGGGSVVSNLLTNFGSAVTSIASALGVSGGAANTVGKIGTILQMALQVLPSILAVAGVALAGPSPDPAQVAGARAYLAAMAGRA